MTDSPSGRIWFLVFLVPEINMARNPYDSCTHARKEESVTAVFSVTLPLVLSRIRNRFRKNRVRTAVP